MAKLNFICEKFSILIRFLSLFIEDNNVMMCVQKTSLVGGKRSELPVMKTVLL